MVASWVMSVAVAVASLASVTAGVVPGGLDRVAGQPGGRSGSFVLGADGAYADGEARTAWHVIEGSETSELTGLRGSGLAVAAAGPGGPSRSTTSSADRGTPSAG